MDLLVTLIRLPEVSYDEFMNIYAEIGPQLLTQLPGVNVAVLKKTKEKADMQTEYLNNGLPNPKIDHATWLLVMHKYDKPVSLLDYQQGGTTPSSVLDMMEGSRRITTGCRDEVLRAEAIMLENQQINHYSLRPEAKQFWQNGIEQGMSAQDILDSWRAMQSIADEIKSDDSEDEQG